ncbi:MAG TPA: malto-oligosyltrehalose trehalohydrolase [Candidatus Tectomicrobia bacterium]|nr:malto-oligosyltrehalose trehalohydrolase [Candidatus Tectomicrobia bacterium]
MDTATVRQRRLPVGAELTGAKGVHVRVWAPRARLVEVVLQDGPTVALEPEPGGYHAGLVDSARPGTRYRFRLDGGSLLPDPASRFQPEGPHGPSCVIDPSAFAWTDGGWRGVRLAGQVLYEMHVGTFTREGTWEAAARELPELARAGITLIEMMPVAEFPGRFGWGYDGVDLFAPTRLYGEPDDLRRFVDRAHALGLGVILDVVYNHLGPDGNYLKAFSEDYFTDRYANEWGEAINLDGEGSAAVREFVLASAAHWIDEYHLDGLRLDATQQMYDASPEHILAALARVVRAAARGRDTLLIAENEPQDVRLVRPPEEGGYGLDAVWNDDFHHAAVVALTGLTAAYYSDYRGTAQEFVSAMKRGFLYQGQRYRWQKKRRGTPTYGLPPATFVTFIQNHDQIANSARGHRRHLLTSPGRYKAMTALMLLGPGTPLLFQGQEFGASAPFLYFADHKPELARQVRRGRADFLRQFPALAAPEMQEQLPDPADRDTFERSRLDLSERERHAETYALHRDLLALRREDAVFASQRPGGLDGAVLSPDAFVLRYFDGEHDERLLLVNLGRELTIDPAPEPLLAPPAGARWEVRWSSEDPRYGGVGTPPVESDEGWHLPAESAIVMQPARDTRSNG